MPCRLICSAALLAVSAAAVFLSGCASFDSEGETAGDPFGEITVTDIDFTVEETNGVQCVDDGSRLTAGVTNDTKTLPLAVYNLPSRNFDRRRLPISLIVVHYTAAPLAESLNALRDTRGSNRVSAHYVVAEDGTIYRLVDESNRAWHAGVSRWRNIVDVNSASVGIEIVNLGHDRLGRPRPYPAKQIESVIRLCLDIQSRHRISEVVGHSDVAPRRKIDPGELFPWKMLSDRGVKVRKLAR